MRYLTCASQTVLTSDDIAEVLTELAAGLATQGQTESVTIPIVVGGNDSFSTVDLLLGPGQDLLSLPADWRGTQPDFAEELQRLRERFVQLQLDD
jgi:hypothetical protein